MCDSIAKFFKKMKLIKKIYSSFRKWEYAHFSDLIECSVGDILLLRDVPRANQLLLTSRLLDVEAFMSGVNKQFPYQNAISYSVYGKEHLEERGNEHFRNLIESYSKEGYHPGSFVTCDKNMMLMDGNHRMGLNIYYKIESVLVRRVHKSVPFQYGGDWYFQVGLPTKTMNDIYDKFQAIQSWLIDSGNTFCLHIKGVDYGDIIEDISHLCTVLKIHNRNEEALLQFSMQNPEYIVKQGGLVSHRAMIIRDIVTTRYEGKVEVSKNCEEGKKMYGDYLKNYA